MDILEILERQQKVNRAKAYSLIEANFRGKIIGDIRIDDFFEVIVDFIMGDYSMKNEISKVIDKLYKINEMAESRFREEQDLKRLQEFMDLTFKEQEDKNNG